MKIKNIKYLCLSFSLFCLNTWAHQIKVAYELRSHISEYPKSKLINHMRLITFKGRPNRFVGEVGHQEFKKYLHSTLMNYKLDDKTTVTNDKFKLNIDVALDYLKNGIADKFPIESPEYKKWQQVYQMRKNNILDFKDKQGENFIWERKGKQKDKILILTAHYDTVIVDKKSMKINTKAIMPGADYNATGVALLLALIDRLYNQDLEYTVRIVFLDAQTIGYLGSYDYAQKIKDEKNQIIGILNLEMLGHDSKLFDKNKKEKNFKAYFRSEKTDTQGADLTLLNYLEQPYKSYLPDIHFEKSPNDFKMSDHFRFWEVGLPAVTLTQNWEDDFNPKFQTQDDFPETINQSSFYAAFQYVATISLTHLLGLNP